MKNVLCLGEGKKICQNIFISTRPSGDTFLMLNCSDFKLSTC